jgi:8-oxo-dGTP pyrophosphatase MutT (NUDIX family)
MRQATLCLLIRENQDGKELLLAMKKRGFGVGKWNGVGGKLDLTKGDKNILAAAIRETEEEIGINPKELEKVAVLSFYFPYKKEWDQDVHVYLIKDWKGEPTESEEMFPKWFKMNEIPFDQMWDDDKFWLPHILQGKKLKAKFVFGQGEKIIEQEIEVMQKIINPEL